MRSYSLRDYGAAMGMTKRELGAYKKQCAWNTKMAALFKSAVPKETPKP